MATCTTLTDINQFPCQQCEKIYNNKQALNRHIKNIHQMTGTTKTCNVCNQSLISNQKLAQHKEAYQHFTIQDIIHPQTKSFMCNLCNFESNLESDLVKHTSKHFQNHNSNLLLFSNEHFQCPFKKCKTKTLDKNIMRQHFNTVHSSNESFQTFLITYGFTLCQKCHANIPNPEFKNHSLKCK